MSPKYRQIGYMDQGSQKRRPARRILTRKDSEPATPRVPEPLKARQSFKCASCGAEQMISESPMPDEDCSNCQAPIKACVNCRFFDTSAPNECTQPIEKPVESKRTRNTCPFFRPTITVDIGVGTVRRRNDARSAFDALFSK